MPEVTGKTASRQSKDTIGLLLGGGVMLTLFGWALVITQQPETRVGSFGDTVTEGSQGMFAVGLLLAQCGWRVGVGGADRLRGRARAPSQQGVGHGRDRPPVRSLVSWGALFAPRVEGSAWPGAERTSRESTHKSRTMPTPTPYLT